MSIAVVVMQLFSVIGIVAGTLMFFRKKQLPVDTSSTIQSTLSIIIPARDEALRIEPLLQSLKAQRWTNFDVIVVDDGSTDETAAVAKSYGAMVLRSEQVGDMPPGKSNACAYGAQHALGDWLLFLDADVQLSNRDSLQRIVEAFNKQQRGILSVQPYHRIIKGYENLSVVFNIIVLTGMNVFTFWGDRFKTAGSFGPCIMCDHDSYKQTGGHAAAAHSIMDDFALSDVFVAKQLRVTNYTGRDVINMRMYEEGLQQLVEGWTKNLATASQSTHAAVMTMIQLWIFGVLVTAISVVLAALTSTVALIISSVLYIAYGIHLYILARRAGTFHPLIIGMYPLFVLFFIGIFMYSLYRTHIVRSVTWRGRNMNV